MLIPISVSNGIQPDEAGMESLTFRDLGVQERHIEELLRMNIDVLFGEDESLLIVGQQVANQKRGRSDLVAVDQDGNLVLIEIKRDVDDIVHRSEAFEIQAIRYAAGLATLTEPDELVERVFAPYINHRQEEFAETELRAEEIADRHLTSFLDKNNATRTFNRQQRIIMVASDFDPQTLSAVAWLISNGVDISCVTMRPRRYNGQDFLELERLLPPTELSDYYVQFDSVKSSGSTVTARDSKRSRTYRPRIPEFFEHGLLQKGETLRIRNHEDSDAEIQDEKHVKYRDTIMRYNDWGMQVTGWSSINIYEWAENEKGVLLDDLRARIVEQAESEEVE